MSEPVAGTDSPVEVQVEAIHRVLPNHIPTDPDADRCPDPCCGERRPCGLVKEYVRRLVHLGHVAAAEAEAAALRGCCDQGRPPPEPGPESGGGARARSP